MPNKLQQAKQNFSVGVVSPRISARIDAEWYNNALLTGKNWIISSQGGAMLREGGQYIGFGAGNQPFRVFRFERGGEISDILVEVNEGIIRFWLDNNGQPELYEDLATLLTDEDDGEFLTDEDDGEFLAVGVVIAPNPYSLADLDNLYFTNQDKFGIIASASHPPFYITLRRDGSILAETLALERIPELAYNDTSSPRIVNQKADWRINFPVSWESNRFVYVVRYNGVVGSPGVFNFTYAFDPTDQEANRLNIKDGLERAAAIQGYTTTFEVIAVDITTYDVNVTGPDSGWNVEITPIFGSTFLPVAIPPVVQPYTDIADPSDPIVEPAWSYPTMVLHNGRYYQCIRVHKSAVTDEPGVGANWEVYWTDLGIAVPPGFDYQYPSGSSWAADTIYSPMGRGFPSVCVFHEQRLILMANPDNPTALYGSGIGEYTAFVPGPNDDQPFLYILDSSDTPQIKWARSSSQMILGTSSGEWMIGGPRSDETITPTGISAEQQNAARSKLTAPVQIDTEIMYVEQGGRKIRSTTYVRDRNSYVSTDISVMAQHLIAEEGVRRIVALRIPEDFIIYVREDGQLTWMTYEKSQPIVAFSEGETDGTIYDAAGYFSVYNNTDSLYLVVQRNNNWMIERMRYPTYKDTEKLTDKGIVCMDSWVTGTVTGNFIDGLIHLEGKTVGVLLDDAWQVGTYVVQAGRVTLDADHTGKTYAVGLVYTGTGKTFEGAVNFQGVSLGTNRRWNELYTRILNSARPIVQGYRSSDRTPSTPMNTAETVLPGIVNLNQSVSGYDDGAITFVQDRPYPTYIIGFYGEYNVEDR